MFWTAFVWGLGVSCGGSCGLLCLVILTDVYRWLSQTKAAKRAAQLNEMANDALQRRNELTKELIVHIATIAEAAETHERYLRQKE